MFLFYIHVFEYLHDFNISMISMISNQFSLYYYKKSYFIYIKTGTFSGHIYLDIRESKQNHETDLQWMVDYISAEKTNAKKIIVYCRYTFHIYSYIHVYNDREEKPLDLAKRKCRRRPLFSYLL